MDINTASGIKWVREGEVKCWACREWMSNNELENADGFCPHCDSEIDRGGYPYADED